jgi:putative RNA 2'-phosphotransferase
MTIDPLRLSKTMAYALRHHPEQFHLQLDAEGWVLVVDLLAALRQRTPSWQQIDIDDLVAAIAQSDKKRYEIRDDKIRAYYGHSIAQKMEREASVPPTTLFHGTTPEAALMIKNQGLKIMGRQYVHLSEDLETARQVALRRTRRPVILEVRARDAHQQGIVFYLGNDSVWLADPIPPAFITFPVA